MPYGADMPIIKVLLVEDDEEDYVLTRELFSEIQGEREVDLQAMAAGAADYLVKGRLDSGLLERSIRYAIERKRAARRAATEQARLAAFGEAVGLALTRRDSLEDILDRCAKAMANSLHGALAGIWVVEENDKELKLMAYAGEARAPEHTNKHP